MSLPHWEYFLAIENDLERCSRYVEFHEDNYRTYSLEFARIIMASASEVDTVMKLICSSIDSSKNPNNIVQYFPIVMTKYPKLTQYTIELPRFMLCFRPWENWAPNQSPEWWSAYNKIKHERDKNFSKANLINAILSVCGLLSGILCYYTECFDAVEIDAFHAPRLLSPKARNQTYVSGAINWEFATIE